MASAFQSLARGTGRQFGGGAVRQTIVEMEHAYLFVTAAGHGACLAVLGEEDSDMGMIAYEMNMLVKRVGTYLSSAPRVEVVPPLPSARRSS
jgi:predicted regulator of Ras-like GTPase activity (Roadblock/LC7/MglB family)